MDGAHDPDQVSQQVGQSGPPPPPPAAPFAPPPSDQPPFGPPPAYGFAPPQPGPWPSAGYGAGKSRLTAAALALLLGGLGIHKFYLDRNVAGLLYLLFCWTGIPSLVAWIEGISYLLKSDEAWAAQHGGPVRRSSAAGAGCLWLVAILPLLSIAAIVALIFLGSQVSSILSNAGRSLETTAPGAMATARPSPTPSPSALVLVTPSPSAPVATARPTARPTVSGQSSMPHQAPDVEALAPAVVGGRPLAIWSMKGEPWLDMMIGLSTSEKADIRDAIAKTGGSLDDCAQVIAGRASVADDPPYFVYLYRFPAAAFDAVAPLILGTAGWLGDLDPEGFHTATLGGKDVYVGTPEMLVQSEHQQGRPYWYELDDHTLAIVITDQETWAIDALRQLP